MARLLVSRIGGGGGFEKKVPTYLVLVHRCNTKDRA